MSEQPLREILSPREVDALRLLARGYDVKSAAAELGVSVHSINERLRDARRKLGVSSSRQAARRWMARGEAGSGAGQKICPEETGVADRAGKVARSSGAGQSGRRRIVTGGVVLMFIALFAGWLIGQHTPPVVLGADAPSVVAATPNDGATIAPGPFDLTVTFDRAMRGDSYSFVQIDPDSYPNCDRAATLSTDRRTFRIRCRAEAGRTYRVGFNTPPYTNFRATSGATARPHSIAFRVSGR